MYRPDEMAMILEQVKQEVKKQQLAGTEVKTLLEETKITIEATDEGNVLIARPAMFFPSGQEIVTVIWNGILYKNIPTFQEMNSSTVAWILGNKSIIGLGEDTGEPYLIMCLEQIDMDERPKTNAIFSKTPGAHTLAVKQETIHPIPQEYIPPLDRLILNGADGNQYALTITDGALSVAPVTT